MGESGRRRQRGRGEPRVHIRAKASGPSDTNEAKGPNRNNGQGQVGKLAEEANALRTTLTFLSDRIDQLASELEKAQLKDYVNLMSRPWQLIWRNLLSGLSRGVGIAIGFTFFAATIVYILQGLGALNLPIVGDYIADIVRIVQRQLEINPY